MKLTINKSENPFKFPIQDSEGKTHGVLEIGDVGLMLWLGGRVHNQIQGIAGYFPGYEVAWSEEAKKAVEALPDGPRVLWRR